MIKKKEEIILEKSSEVGQVITSYVNELDRLSGTDEFTIDNIEKLWAGLDESTNKIYKAASSEIIEQMDEKEIIRSKKKNISKRE